MTIEELKDLCCAEMNCSESACCAATLNMFLMWKLNLLSFLIFLVTES